MKWVDPRRATNLKCWVEAPFETYEEYEAAVLWIANNIPSTERFTPKWRGSYVDEGDDEPRKIRFGFVSEETAMAFRLALPNLEHVKIGTNKC